jgi:plasmid maintenance system killer protein
VTAHYTQRLLKSYAKASPEVQRAFDKQVSLLLADPYHPSLRTKKYDEATGMWQARVNRNWRFYFTIEENTYHLIEMTPHPK